MLSDGRSLYVEGTLESFERRLSIRQEGGGNDAACRRLFMNPHPRRLRPDGAGTKFVIGDSWRAKMLFVPDILVTLPNHPCPRLHRRPSIPAVNRSPEYRAVFAVQYLPFERDGDGNVALSYCCFKGKFPRR